MILTFGFAYMTIYTYCKVDSSILHTPNFEYAFIFHVIDFDLLVNNTILKSQNHNIRFISVNIMLNTL